MLGAWSVFGDTLDVVLDEVAELALAIAVGLGTFHSEQRNNSGARYVLGRIFTGHRPGSAAARVKDAEDLDYRLSFRPPVELPLIIHLVDAVATGDTVRGLNHGSADGLNMPRQRTIRSLCIRKADQLCSCEFCRS